MADADGLHGFHRIQHCAGTDAHAGGAQGAAEIGDILREMPADFRLSQSRLNHARRPRA